jgi:hypothetical protein
MSSVSVIRMGGGLITNIISLFGQDKPKFGSVRRTSSELSRFWKSMSAVPSRGGITRRASPWPQPLDRSQGGIRVGEGLAKLEHRIF